MHYNKTVMAENIFNFTGKVAKSEMLIANYKCIKLDMRSRDPVSLNAQLLKV